MSALTFVTFGKPAAGRKPYLESRGILSDFFGMAAVCARKAACLNKVFDKSQELPFCLF